MDQVIKKIIDWSLKHPVTIFFISVHLILSMAYIFIPIEKSIFQQIINIFMTPDMSITALNIIFSLLFSGIELSIGSLHYAIWLLWSACFLFCFRNYFFKLIPFQTSKKDTTNLMFGPTFIVFSVYLTFVFIHRPIIFFKLFGKFRFTDTLLYSIGVFQYMTYKLPDHFFDFISCILSNIIWKFINLIVSYIERREHQETTEITNVNIERDTQLPLEANNT